MRTVFVALALAGTVVVGAAPGWSAPLTATEATTLLSRAYATAGKCQMLSAAERDELMDFLARAEIALAEQLSIKQTRAAVAKGRSLGNASACGEDDRQLVTSTLALARSAQSPAMEVEKPVEAATEPAPQPTPEPVPPAVAEQEAEPEPDPVVSASQPALASVSLAAVPAAQPVKRRKPAKAVDASLSSAARKEQPRKLTGKPSLVRYAGVAEKYYVELKCRSMSGAAIKRLYATVLSSHRKALAENDAAQVRTMLRSAEARAGSARCG